MHMHASMETFLNGNYANENEGVRKWLKK